MIIPAFISGFLTKPLEKEVERMIKEHRNADRINFLLRDPSLGERVSGNGFRPNCFGGAFWVFGFSDKETPQYVDEIDTKSIIETRFVESQMPSGLVIVRRLNGRLFHGGVYIGRSKLLRKHIIFHQPGPGLKFKWDPYYSDQNWLAEIGLHEPCYYQPIYEARRAG